MLVAIEANLLNSWSNKLNMFLNNWVKIASYAAALDIVMVNIYLFLQNCYAFIFLDVK